MDYNCDLDTPLLRQKTGLHWSIRHAIENLQIFGSIGSGKTSGSGSCIANKYLRNGFGGIILTAKQGEADHWKRLAARAGRLKDIVEISPNHKNYFNFLEHISSTENSKQAITSNICNTLNTVIQASKEKDSGVSNDPFWNESLQLVLHNIVSLCLLAYGKVTVEHIYAIAQTLPKKEDQAPKPEKESTSDTNAFQKAWKKAMAVVNKDIDAWHCKLQGTDKNFHTRHKSAFEEGIVKHVESARQLKLLHEFFFTIFFRLAEKTRSIIDFSILSFMSNLLQEPLYSLFCKHKSNVRPEDTFDGKLIIVNIPVMIYERAGRDCQTLFKLIYQKSVEKRNVKNNNRPVVIWTDECHFFITDYDPIFQSTSRENIVSTVNITQNLAQYYSNLNTSRSESKVKSLLGTIGTKIFHANSDVDTNKYGSELVGETKFIETSISKEDYSTKGSWSEREVVRLYYHPSDFIKLRTGGPKNNFYVEGIMHVQGRPIFSEGRNYAKVRFKQ